jgi:hypothetical protein
VTIGVSAQAYFLHHYKVVQTIPGVSNSRKVLWIDGADRIGVLVEDSGVKMDLYCWNPQDEQFTKDGKYCRLMTTHSMFCFQRLSHSKVTT